MNEIYQHVLNEFAVRQIPLTPVSDDELEYLINKALRIIRICRREVSLQAGEHRKPDWENGWAETSQIPGYFGKYRELRMGRQFVRSAVDPTVAEYLSFCAVRDYVLRTYIPPTVEAAYEFGSGSGHNLPSLQQILPRARIWGLDWVDAAVENARRRFCGELFDMFEPKNFSLQRNSVVVTIASMEQLGTRFEKILWYLLCQDVRRVIHIEPINELLDDDHVLDHLSLEYSKARGYLTGYLSRLRELESAGTLRILAATRSYVGSFLLDGYSVVVWEPTLDFTLQTK